MSDRVQELIRSLQLVPHPEGGAFREIHRSGERVRLADGSERAASTAIHFLLARGEISRWHRVAHDEVWHFYEGDPLELNWIDADFVEARTVPLGPAVRDGSFAAVVPAGSWQAARTLGDYSLVGCTVAPGFEFSDWTLMRDESGACVELRRRFPALEALL